MGRNAPKPPKAPPTPKPAKAGKAPGQKKDINQEHTGAPPSKSSDIGAVAADADPSTSLASTSPADAALADVINDAGAAIDAIEQRDLHVPIDVDQYAADKHTASALIVKLETQAFRSHGSEPDRELLREAAAHLRAFWNLISVDLTPRPGAYGPVKNDPPLGSSLPDIGQIG